MALRIGVYRYCVPVLLCRLLLATERCTSLTTDRRHVWTDGLDSVTHCDDSCHVISCKVRGSGSGREGINSASRDIVAGEKFGQGECAEMIDAKA
jgi:hypothetical protein